MKRGAFFGIVSFFLFLFTQTASAQVAEESYRIPGTTEGTGTYFEVTDSEYLNITLESSEEIAAKIESAPEMVILNIGAAETTASSVLTFAGFSPNTTYHRYTDNYHNHESVTTDENGLFSFAQDIGSRHVIFIQPRKSTKFIKDNATGGDCTSIGSWDASSKTCVLNKEVNETIQIDNDGITLDGGGHTLNGNKNNGIFVYGGSATIKNITISLPSIGIYLNSSDNKVNDVVIKNSQFTGIQLSYSNRSVVSANTITGSRTFGVSVYYSESNVISDNTISGGSYGISQEYLSNSNTYDGNIILNNTNTGIRVTRGAYSILRNNRVESNLYDGIVIQNTYGGSLTGNRMSSNGTGNANGRSNFSITGEYMATTSIDQSNTVEGKPIYYEKNVVGKTYDSSLNIGSFYCLTCKGITVKDLVLSDHGAKIFLWDTSDSLVDNVVSSDKTIQVSLSGYSWNNTVRNSDLGTIAIHGVGNINTIYNNNFSDTGAPVYTYTTHKNVFYRDLPIGGNYWKKNEANCKDLNGDKICDSSFVFDRVVDKYPWAQPFYHEPIPVPEPVCTENCHSNVLFLPGINPYTNKG